MSTYKIMCKMTFTLNVIIFCFSILLTSYTTASKSFDEDWDYLTSDLNEQEDESKAIHGKFRNIHSEKFKVILLFSVRI